MADIISSSDHKQNPAHYGGRFWDIYAGLEVEKMHSYKKTVIFCIFEKKVNQIKRKKKNSEIENG